MEIEIRYQLRGETQSRRLTLTPEQYFVPLPAGEPLTIRSTPRKLDVYEYTPFPATQLDWTCLEIKDNGAFWRIRTQFLDGARSMLEHTLDSDGREELIQSTELAPSVSHVVRILKEPGRNWTMIHNSVQADRPVQVQWTGTREFDGGRSYEALREFGAVR